MKSFRGKLLLVLALVAALWASSKAFANYGVQGGDLGSGAQAFQQVTVTTSGTIGLGTIPVGTVLIGVKITSTGSGAACGWYDTGGMGTTSVGTSGTIIDEIAENTTSTTDVQIWPRPYKVKTQLAVIATSAACTVYY